MKPQCCTFSIIDLLTPQAVFIRKKNIIPDHQHLFNSYHLSVNHAAFSFIQLTVFHKCLGFGVGTLGGILHFEFRNTEPESACNTGL